MDQERQPISNHRELESLDDEYAARLRSDGVSPRRSTRPLKDDRRSSSKLTERERSERWPIG